MVNIRMNQDELCRIIRKLWEVMEKLWRRYEEGSVKTLNYFVASEVVGVV